MALIDEVERILSALAQEVEQEASVLVQFAAGDWQRLKNAYHEERGDNVPAIPDDAPVTDPAPPVNSDTTEGASDATASDQPQ